MSITVSLQNALSGLSAAGKGAQAVSANVANALTPGFGRREAVLGVQGLNGSGDTVRVVRVDRFENTVLLNDRRAADANTGGAQTRADALQRIQQAIGLPEDNGSLTGLISQFDARLIEAASRPDNTARLNAVASAASDLTTKLGNLTDTAQQVRMDADKSIAQQVETLNITLQQVERLNAEIFRSVKIGRDANAMIDERQALVDTIAQIVPLRQVETDGERIRLFTPTGAVLLDGPAATIGFAETGVITADMTLASGALSGLTINGNAVSTSGATAGIAGGTLAATFAVRDEIATNAQAGFDSVARDLIQRFETPGVDPTLIPGTPSLFTDAGATLDPAMEEGLAGRIQLNALADPASGGDSWLFRTGLGATAPGDPGDSTQINRWVDALSSLAVTGSPGDDGIARSTAGHASRLLTNISTSLRAAETEVTFESARLSSLRSTELESGVDTDQEMQKLLVIEQAYAANARVIQTIDELIDTIIRI